MCHLSTRSSVTSLLHIYWVPTACSWRVMAGQVWLGVLLFYTCTLAYITIPGPRIWSNPWSYVQNSAPVQIHTMYCTNCSYVQVKSKLQQLREWSKLLIKEGVTLSIINKLLKGQIGLLVLIHFLQWFGWLIVSLQKASSNVPDKNVFNA
jgi:hypothetical protein